MDMSITNPYWDSIANMLKGFNRIIEKPDMYSIKNWVKDG